jgi:O-antigen ligase
MANLNISNRAASAALLALPLAAAWFFVPQLADAFEIKHHILYFGVMILVLALLRAGQLANFSVPGGLLGCGLLVWLLGVGVSFYAASNDYFSTRTLLEVVACLLLTLALFNLRDPKNSLRILEHGIIIASLGVAVFALKQQFLPDWLDPGFSALGKLQIYSTLGNPNLAALIIQAGVALAARRIFQGSFVYRASHAVCTLLMLGGLAATQARHALIALAVMTVVALLWMGTQRVRWVTLAALLAAAGAAIAALFFMDLPPSVTHSFKGRAFIWLTSLQMLREHPLTGVGLGQYGINHMAYQGELFATGRFGAYFDNASVITEGHNDFLNWGAMSGMAGLIGFALLCAVTLWKGWRSSSLKQEAPQIYLALTGQVAAMFFIAVTSYTVPGLFFWLLLGAAWARIGLPRFSWTPHTGGRLAFTACLIALLAVDFSPALHEVRGAYIEARGDRLMEEHDLWLARKEYQRALQWDPHNGRLRKKYATGLFLSGELPQALAELEIAKRYSGDLGIYLLEGELRARLGDLEGAGTVYRQIIASFPEMVSAHFILGQVYQLQGRKQEAIAEFHKVLDIQPSPFNLNMTPEKVELQKRIVRDYLDTADTPRSGQGAAPVPGGISDE